MINNSTNLNKTNNYLSPPILDIEDKTYHIWRWKKSFSWLGTSTKIWRGKTD